MLVKQIKPDFKVLGPRFGKDMKAAANAISAFDQKQIAILEKDGEISVFINEEKTILALAEVIISSQDIEGWLVANADGVTVALDVTITPSLRNEGIAREIVNRIQNLRKDSGYEVTDRIEVQSKIDDGLEIAFDDIETRIRINKH